MATKKAKKKAVKKVKKAKAAPRSSRLEIVVRTQTEPTSLVPTQSDLSEPMRDGKKLTIPPTWMAEKQIIHLVQKTPPQHVYRRKGRGGQAFDYVTGSYVVKALNFVFGWNWDFEISEQGREADQVWVKGRLTVRGTKAGQEIVKTQFGRADIKYKKDSKIMLDYGNDLKAAATDAMKKCASMLGIASDIYGKTEYKDESGIEPREEAPRAPQAQLPAPKAPQAQVRVEQTIEDDPILRVCHGASKSGCGNDLTPQEFEFSKKIYGKPLCRACQKVSTPRK